MTNGQAADPTQQKWASSIDAAVVADGSNLDLSADPVTAVQGQRVSLATRYHQHRIHQEENLFSILVALVLLLYCVGVVFSGTVLFAALRGSIVADWHIWLLGPAFIVPPTIISIVLVRATYLRTQGKDNVADDVPVVSLTKAAIEALKSS